MSGADPCAMLKHGALLADAEGRKGDARDYRMALAAVAELIEACVPLVRHHRAFDTGPEARLRAAIAKATGGAA